MVLYTKHCASCQFPEKIRELRTWCEQNNYKLEVKRTAYRPHWHKEASELWGSEDYAAFLCKEGKVMDFMSWRSKTKSKPVKGAEKENDVQGLPKAKRTNRKSRVASKKTQPKKKDVK